MRKELIKPLMIFAISLVAFWRILFGGNGEKELQNLEGKNSSIILQGIEHQYYQQFQQYTSQIKKNHDSDSISEKLSVAVPDYFLQYDLQNFFLSLKNEGIDITTVSYQDFDEIKKKIQRGEVDIALLPYDQVKNEQFLSFSFQEDLTPFFKNEVSSLIRGKTIQFLPFSLDPLGLFAFSGTFSEKKIKDNLLSFDEIEAFLFSWKSKKTLSFPVWFGIRNQSLKNPNDIDNTIEIFWNELFTLSEKIKDDTYLSGWINAIFMTNIKGNFTDFEKNMFDIKEKVDPQIKNCEDYQKECLFLYHFVDMIPEFYSRKNLFLDKFSQKKDSLKEIQFFLPPFAKVQEPLRIWGWVASDTIEDTTHIYRFLENYMGISVMTGEKIDLFPSMIPAFSGENFSSSIDLSRYKTKIITEYQFLNKHKKDIPLQQLLDYDIDAKTYLGI